MPTYDCPTCEDPFHSEREYLDECPYCGAPFIVATCGESPNGQSPDDLVVTPQIPGSVSDVLFSFDGRISRSEQWLKGFLPLLPFSIMINILLYGVDTDSARAIAIFFLLLGSWPNFAIITKRLHDRNMSAWWLFMLLIPYVGAIWLLIQLWFLKGTDGPNRFGEDPLYRYASRPSLPDTSKRPPYPRFYTI